MVTDGLVSKTDDQRLPMGWELATIGELFTFKNGLNKAKEYFGYGTPILNYMDVFSSPSLRIEDIGGRVTVNANEKKAYEVRQGDVFFTRTSEIAEEIGITSVMLDAPRDTVFSGFILRARPINDRLEDSYKAYCFSPRYVREQIISKATYTTRALTNGRTLSSISLVIPPRNEQQAIAEALGDVDALIESLEGLIAKKRDIKQATMQQLLTGQTRLPGFDGPWTETKLGLLGKFLKGRAVNRGQAQSGKIRCVRYGELYTDHDDIIRHYVSWISREVANQSTRLHSGDILFAGSGETKAEIGKCAAFVNEVEAYAGGDIVILRPARQDARFLGYYLNQPTIAQQKASKGQGDAVVHINSRALADIDCLLPDHEEQAAIATVIADIDNEIQGLERRLFKTRDIKQSMMQQLLAGKVRLVASHAALPEYLEAGAPFNGATLFDPALFTSPLRERNRTNEDAAITGYLAYQFGSPSRPLGNVRRVKLSYLFRRHTKTPHDGYVKKAAGPYDPTIRYGGALEIALANHLAKEAVGNHKGKYTGLVGDTESQTARELLDEWFGNRARTWLDQFEHTSTDDLECLATVDLALLELRAKGEKTTVSSVKSLIQSEPEWIAKLSRAAFSDSKIAEAIRKSTSLFGKGMDG